MPEPSFTLPPGWRVAGGGMADLMASTDWTATALGGREGWSQSLRIAVDMIMASAFPMALRWGPDFVLIYNDAYRPILGDKHPSALGRPAREAWAEVWPQLAPGHEAILAGRSPAVFAEDILLRIQRRGEAWEDAHFTLSYSPVPDPSAPTGVGGILVTAVETTARIAAEKALYDSRAYLQDLLDSSGEAFYALDRDGVTRLCNRAFLRMLGFEREEDVVGLRLHDVIHHSHPDGRPYPVEECPIYLAASTGEPCHIEDEVFFPVTGEPLPVEYWVRPIYRDGRPHRRDLHLHRHQRAQGRPAGPGRERGAVPHPRPGGAEPCLDRPTPAGFPTGSTSAPTSTPARAEGSLIGEGWAPSSIPKTSPKPPRSGRGRWRPTTAFEAECRLHRADGAWRWHLARALPIRDADWNDHALGRDQHRHRGPEDDRETLAAPQRHPREPRGRAGGRTRPALADLPGPSGGRRPRTASSGRPTPPGRACWAGPRTRSSAGTTLPSCIRRIIPEATTPWHTALASALPNYENRVLHKDGGFRWISWVRVERRRADLRHGARRHRGEAGRRRSLPWPRRRCGRARRWRRSGS